MVPRVLAALESWLKLANAFGVFQTEPVLICVICGYVLMLLPTAAESNIASVENLMSAEVVGV
jgi:hypothetical protein